MVRLPTPGSDEGKWGEILNEFLSQAHANDGKLKADSVTTTQLAPGSVNNIAISDSAVSNTKLDNTTKASLAKADSSLQSSNNLLDVADVVAARNSLGLGDAATKSIGTSSGSVAAGDDPRISGALSVSVINAKGDLLVGTADNTVTRVTVGADGQVLTADSSQSSGVKWEAAAESIPIEQTDFVGIAEQFSAYQTMEIKKIPPLVGTDPALEVSCLASDGRHITYVIANTTANTYRIVSQIYEGATSSTFYPDPTTSLSVDHGANDFRSIEAVLSGTFNTSSTYYTTQIGAYFEASAACQINGGQMQISLRTYRDDRGGIWRLSITGHPELGTQDVSIWATNPGGIKQTIWTIDNVPQGAYTLRATFQGDDPANPPSSGAGTARGWMTSATELGFTVRISDIVPTRDKTNAPKGGHSNPDFAISIRPLAGGTYRFVPYHNQDGEMTENQASPPVFYDGLEIIDFASMTIGERRPINHGFEIVQHITGRNTTGGQDLIEVWTKQLITPDGVHHVNGSVKVLADIQIHSSSYVMMHVVNPAIFDRLVSSWGNPYGIDKANHADGTTTDVTEGVRARSRASVSAANPDLFSAMRVRNLEQTFRASRSVHTQPAWIEHRDSTMTKLYNRLGYITDTTVLAGTTWKFSGDYWYGRLPGIGPVVSPA